MTDQDVSGMAKECQARCVDDKMTLFSLVLLGLVGICLAAEVCYPPCGCFSDAAPFDDRDLPESPAEQQLTWLLYNQDSPSTAIPISLNNIPSQYDPTKPTKFLIHGWTSDSGAMVGTRDAFLLSRGLDYNVISVDWGEGASWLWYPQSASNTRVVGACTGELAKKLVAETGASLDDMHCIGRSLGAHTCGYMGKQTDGALGRVTGLDPAGPWFETDDTRVRMDATDCQFMDNIHTDGYLSLGLGLPIGHADFFPNKALSQPPCGDDISCNHNIAVSYFIESIRSTECNFSAYPCSSNADADAGRCESCTEGVDCQKMGYSSESMPGRGTFFLRTTPNAPYCVD